MDSPAFGSGWLALAGLALFLSASPAQAGQGRDNCVGYIDTLPAQLNTQGTWCMRGDLSTGLYSGGGIQINLNNVVVDCNGYRIENTLPGNRASGVTVTGNNNTIRNCDVRGYFAGMLVSGDNNLIEDNRLQDIGHVGLQVDPATTIRRNVIRNVGGDTTFEGHIAGIVGGGDITDNLIDGVFAKPDVNLNGFVSGIATRGGEGVITRNRVRNIRAAGNGWARAIETDASYHYITWNHIVGPAADIPSYYAIYCSGGESHARDNIASGYDFVKTSGNTTYHYSGIVCNFAGGTNISKP
jgi:hypothetical protein